MQTELASGELTQQICKLNSPCSIGDTSSQGVTFHSYACSSAVFEEIPCAINSKISQSLQGPTGENGQVLLTMTINFNRSPCLKQHLCQCQVSDRLFDKLLTSPPFAGASIEDTPLRPEWFKNCGSFSEEGIGVGVGKRQFKCSSSEKRQLGKKLHFAMRPWNHAAILIEVYLLHHLPYILRGVQFGLSFYFQSS